MSVFDSKLFRAMRIVPFDLEALAPELSDRSSIDALIANERFTRDLSAPFCKDCVELAETVDDYERANAVLQWERGKCLWQRDVAIRGKAFYRSCLIASLAVGFIFFCVAIWEWLG